MTIRNFQPAMGGIVALGGKCYCLRDCGHRLIKYGFGYPAALRLDEPPQRRGDLLHP